HQQDQDLKQIGKLIPWVLNQRRLSSHLTIQNLLDWNRKIFVLPWYKLYIFQVRTFVTFNSVICIEHRRRYAPANKIKPAMTLHPKFETLFKYHRFSRRCLVCPWCVIKTDNIISRRCSIGFLDESIWIGCSRPDLIH